MNSHRCRRLIAAAGVSLALSAGTVACGSASKPAATEASPPAVATSSPAASTVADGIPEIVEQVQPSIVTVFAHADAGEAGGVGSGVVYRRDGIILTNNHVVAGAARIEVGMADGTRIPARVLARDADTDLAVIRVERANLPVAHFEDALPRVGSPAVVLGSPLGFERTVTAGIVSGLHREIPGSASQTRALVDLIQTDAAISPGNSGGAVVDARGRVLGISVAYVPPSQGAVAVGFAIPSAMATRVADELLENGRARHAYIGVQPGQLTAQIAGELHVTGQGVVVYAVAPDGPAAKAGLRPGDVLTAVGGEKVAGVEELYAALRRHQPGESVAIAYARDGHERSARLLIVDRPS